MGRYYGHRVTKRERAAVNTLYAPPRVFTQNERNAFSHSIQCDQFFSVKSNTIGGVEHLKCLCWCHRALTLYGQPEPEYDLTPPPEYANSADLAFIEGLSSSDRQHPANTGAVVLDSRLNEIEARRIGPESLAEGSKEAGGVSLVAASFASLAPEFEMFDADLQSVGFPVTEPEPYDPIPLLQSDRFPNRSRQELAKGKCDTCGDALTACECTE